MRSTTTKRLISIRVNGETHEIAVEPQATLVEILRERLGLTGVKTSCGVGECGACTVLIDGEPMLACLILAVECQQQEITTIEGLAKEEKMSFVQKSFVDSGAIQCGFCTPGMVLSATALLRQNPHPSDEEIQKALEGNLCRCTGYNKIIEAVKKAGAPIDNKE